MDETIFLIERQDWKYKGILFAEVDSSEIDKQLNCPPEMKTPKNYVAGLMALIWQDEKDDWFMKLRIKYPSGNKHVVCKEYGSDCNETKILSDIYIFPLVNKNWHPNKDGSIDGIIEIMRKSGMIESIEIRKKD